MSGTSNLPDRGPAVDGSPDPNSLDYSLKIITKEFKAIESSQKDREAKLVQGTEQLENDKKAIINILEKTKADLANFPTPYGSAAGGQEGSSNLLEPPKKVQEKVQVDQMITAPDDTKDVLTKRFDQMDNQIKKMGDVTTQLSVQFSDMGKKIGENFEILFKMFKDGGAKISTNNSSTSTSETMEPMDVDPASVGIQPQSPSHQLSSDTNISGTSEAAEVSNEAEHETKAATPVDGLIPKTPTPKEVPPTAVGPTDSSQSAHVLEEEPGLDSPANIESSKAPLANELPKASTSDAAHAVDKSPASIIPESPSTQLGFESNSGKSLNAKKVKGKEEPKTAPVPPVKNDTTPSSPPPVVVEPPAQDLLTISGPRVDPTYADDLTDSRAQSTVTPRKKRGRNDVLPNRSNGASDSPPSRIRRSASASGVDSQPGAKRRRSRSASVSSDNNQGPSTSTSRTLRSSTSLVPSTSTALVLTKRRNAAPVSKIASRRQTDRKHRQPKSPAVTSPVRGRGRGGGRGGGRGRGSVQNSSIPSTSAGPASNPTSGRELRERTAPAETKSPQKTRKPLPKPLSEAEKQSIAAFSKISNIWYGTHAIKSHVALIKSSGREVDPVKLEKVERYITEFEEKDPLNGSRKEFDVKTLAEDNDDYRFLSLYRTENTCTMVDEIKSQEDRPNGHLTLSPLPFLVDMSSKTSNSAAAIRNAADSFTLTGMNTLYKKRELVPPKINLELREKEKKLYKGDKVDDLQPAVPTMTLKSREELFSEDTKDFLESHALCVISGLQRVSGLDGQLFTLEALAEAHPKQKIDTPEQVAQSVNSNYDVLGKKSWEVPTKKPYNSETQHLKIFKEIVEEQKKFAEDLFNAVAEVDLGAFEDTILEKMLGNRQRQLEAKKERARKQKDKAAKESLEAGEAPQVDESLQDEESPLSWRYFGSNIDLIYEKKIPGKKPKVKQLFHTKQRDELMKLPEFLRPKSWNNMLSFAGCNLLGINTAQVYGKMPGARTAAHMENSLMHSINQNCGPDPCVWFGVTYEYWGRLVELVDEHFEEGGFHSQRYWPDEKELRKAEIPYFKFEQKADEMVYVNTGTFHWVQSQGFCTNVSWNLGPSTPTQLATSIIAAQHNVKLGHTANVPLRNIILNLAERKTYQKGSDMYNIIRHQLALLLFHARHCENVYNKEKQELEAGEYSADVSPAMCGTCYGEAAVIVRKKKTGGKKPPGGQRRAPEETDYWCSSCTVDPTLNGVKHTSYWSVERLSAIYDEWIEGNEAVDDGPTDDFMPNDPDDNWMYKKAADIPSSSNSGVPNPANNQNMAADPEVVEQEEEQAEVVEQEEDQPDVVEQEEQPEVVEQAEEHVDDAGSSNPVDGDDESRSDEAKVDFEDESGASDEMEVDGEIINDPIAPDVQMGEPTEPTD